jgi:hypothetical protein
MNVVKLEQFAANRGAQGFRPYAGLLAECRNQVIDRLSAAIQGAVEEIDEGLQARRLGSITVEESDVIAEVQMHLRRCATHLTSDFRAAFESAYQQRVNPPPAHRGAFETDSGNMLEWSLTDDDQISDELLVQNLARGLDSAADAELKELRPRVAHMLNEESMEDDQDPLGPKALTEALKQACWSIDTGRAVRVEMLTLLTRALREPVSTLYRDINVLLVARKVTPRVRRTVKRDTQRPSARASARQPDGAPPSEQDTSNILQRLFTPHGGSDDDGDGAGFGATLGQQSGPRAARMATENLAVIEALTRLQKGEAGVALGGETFDLAEEENNDGMTNVLRRLIDSGIGRHVGAVDGIIIDVVAALFDYIFDDPHVPAPMKGLIGRLQIPALKLAMMDHAFFSNRAHPARRLVNMLAQGAAAWDGEFSTASSLYQFAEPLVVRIQDEFAENTEVFAICLTELETFMAELEEAADAQAEALSDELENRERLEIARVVAQNTTATHLANPEIPESVRQFIGEHWFEVLVKAAMAGSGDGAEWQDAAKTMDDLAWSVQPMRGADDRQRLVKTLPTLLRGIGKGLEQIKAEAGLKEAFFADLMKLHAAAVKAGMVPELANKPPAPIVVPEPLPMPEPAEGLSELARGAWLNLLEPNGESRRVRLSWVSPGRTMYLFTNHQGERAVALTHIELSARFDAGTATPAHSEPLLDRAVDTVLDDFEAHA